MKELHTTYKRPLFFVLKFVLLYVVMNVLYALYVNAYLPGPDAITKLVTRQTSYILQVLGEETSSTPSAERAYVYLSTPESGNVLSVYEGCNAINVVIIFLAFLLALPFNQVLLWFVPLGLLIIHLSNLARIALLYFVSLHYPDAMYFVHKYLFTAFIFAVVFVLWFWYVKRYVRLHE